jgi:hypothetical protein
MLESFLGQLVVVETPAGVLAGVLEGVDISRHGGLGCLLVYAVAGSWSLVKTWTAIKTYVNDW